MSNEKKVKKQNKRPRMKKNIKQFSIVAPRIKQMIRESGSWNAESYAVYVTQKQEFLFSMGELNYLANQYGKVKNYVYSRFSGINSLHLLKDYKKSIRDTWTKKAGGFAKQWKLPARYWKQALDEAIANIKSLWSNAVRKTKSCVHKNENLTEDEKHYIYYMLSDFCLFQPILQKQTFECPISIQGLVIREHYVHHLMCRLLRRYRGKVPHTKQNKSMMIDANMYRYDENNEKNYIKISTRKHSKFATFCLRDKNQYKGNLRILIRDKGIEIHRTVDCRTQKVWVDKNIIAIDKGYRKLLATSQKKYYGTDLNKIATNATETLSEINKRRNPIYSRVRVLKAEARIENNQQKLVLARRIENNNLGKKKYERMKRRLKEHVKSETNRSLNEFYYTDKPSMLISENLNWMGWSHAFSKKVNRILSQWMKGYVADRIDYKNKYFQVAHEEVNAAYTSQVCHLCDEFGTRKNEVFICKKCGQMDADSNASGNILERYTDTDITKYLSYKKVKTILLNRLKTKKKYPQITQRFTSTL